MMSKCFLHITLIFAATLLFAFTAYAADPLPGDACPVDGYQMSSGGAESSGSGNMMVCESGTWKSILGFNGLGQVTAIGNQTCASGEVLAFDGTKWVCSVVGGGGLSASDFVTVSAFVDSTSTGGAATWSSKVFATCPANHTLVNWGLEKNRALLNGTTSYHYCDVGQEDTTRAYVRILDQSSNTSIGCGVRALCLSDDAGGGGGVILGDSLWQAGVSAGDVHYSSGNVGIGTPDPASALDINGGVKIANDAAACTSVKDGTIRYTGGDPPWEYCDGGTTSWLPFKQPRCQDDDTGECYLDATRADDDPEFIAANIADGVNILGVTGTFTGGGGGGCTAPTLCPNVGDVCDDSNAGTTNDPIFAGWLIYNNSTCEPLFVTDDNQSTSDKWKTSRGSNDIAIDSIEDGKINHANRGGLLSDFPAFELCENLTDGGYTDWYLPARMELDLLWRNFSAINSNAAGNLVTEGSLDGYWSSTERDTNSAWSQRFGTGDTNMTFKDNGFHPIRCVRRD